MRQRHLIFSACVLLLGASALAEIGEISVNAHSEEQTAPAAPADKSAMWIDSGTRIFLMIKDSKGKKTGVDAATKKTFKQIAHSECEPTFIDNQYTGDTDELQERITLEPAYKGTYIFHITGIQPGPFLVSIVAQSRAGSSLPSKDLEGLISEGEKKTFTVSFQPDAASAITVVEDSPAAR